MAIASYHRISHRRRYTQKFGAIVDSHWVSSLPSVCRARSTSANGTKALGAEMDRGALVLKLGLIDGGPVSHITFQVALCSSLS